MIAVDTNILVYAHREDAPGHDKALRYITNLAEGDRSWAIPWPCLHEFIAIVTHPRIYIPPTPLERALDQVDAWLESPSLQLLSESPQHWQTLRQLLKSGKIHGPKTHDARIAAMAIDHNAKHLASSDRDFSRFAKLKTFNPIVD